MQIIFSKHDGIIFPTLALIRCRIFLHYVKRHLIQTIYTYVYVYQYQFHNSVSSFSTMLIRLPACTGVAVVQFCFCSQADRMFLLATLALVCMGGAKNSPPIDRTQSSQSRFMSVAGTVSLPAQKRSVVGQCSVCQSVSPISKVFCSAEFKRPALRLF